MTLEKFLGKFAIELGDFLRENDNNPECMYEELVEEMAEKVDKDVYFSCGETRFVLCHPKWDKVIKMNRFDNVSRDYNALELDHYEKAIEWGIDRIFLPIEQVLTVCGYDIYVQTKYTTSVCDQRYKDSRKIAEQVNELYSQRICNKAYNRMYDAGRIDRVWHARAYQIYGKQFMKTLEKFTRELHIGDLHRHNIGYLGKQPIILDYAGYFD